MAMDKYTLRDPQVEAVRWFSGDDIPEVKQFMPEIVLSMDGTYFYVNADFGAGRMADAWIPVGPAVGKLNGPLPFAMYDVKRGDVVPVDSRRPLLNRYLEYMGLESLPPQYGFVGDHKGRRLLVHDGDWVVKLVDGSFTVISHEDFIKIYKKV